MNLLAQKRSAAALFAVGALSFGLSACGSHDSADHNATDHDGTSSAARVEHNAADVSFVQGMVPHHLGALEMAELADSRASSPEVKVLAAEIRAAQQPEIDVMKGWLSQWGVAASNDDHSGHDVSAEIRGDDMPGMMSTGQMAELEAANGATFDTLFLELMIEHHEGAITMATTELADGISAAAKSLAQTITTSQRTEVDKMKQLLTAR